MHRLQRIRRTYRLKKRLGLIEKKSWFNISIFTKSDIAKFISLLLLIIFICFYFACDGWSVMGYALDKSQEDIKIDTLEINE